MKVLLVKPGIALGDHIQPPLGIAYVASRLREKHEVAVLDFGMMDRKDGLFTGELRRFAPDVVGFQCYSPEIGEVKRLSGLARAALPKAVILAGGPHPTLCPEETMAKLSPETDYLLRGETEESFLLFLEKLGGGVPPEKVPGLVWRENGALKVNEICPIADTRKAFSKVPGGRLFVVRGTGHDAPLEAPRLFHETLRKALAD